MIYCLTSVNILLYNIHVMNSHFEDQTIETRNQEKDNRGSKLLLLGKNIQAVWSWAKNINLDFQVIFNKKQSPKFGMIYVLARVMGNWQYRIWTFITYTR